MAELHYHIDEPTDWDVLRQYVFIRGWCFSSIRGAVRNLRLRHQDLCIYGEMRKFRPDVLSAFSEAPDDFTGFELRGIVPSGSQTLTLEVQFDDGIWHVVLSRDVTIQRRWLPLWLGAGNWAELIFSQFSCQSQYPPRPLKGDTFPSPASPSARWPKLSIVSPSLQQASFIGDTIRSVLRQTGVDCEYVIQDGGSTDGSVEIIHRWSKALNTANDVPAHSNQQPEALDSTLVTPRIKAWASEPDEGQADAIRRAFAKTSGDSSDLMAWINSDDFYLPGTFAFVADFFARHPEADVIYGHRLLVDEQSREIGRWFLPEHNNEVLRLYDFIPQETMFWRRRLWDKVGGIDRSYKFAMDWDLLLRFQSVGARIVRVPYFLACFRIHPAQKTSVQMQTMGQNEIDALRTRTFSRQVAPSEVEQNPVLLRYLRQSAWLRFLWKFGMRK